MTLQETLAALKKAGTTQNRKIYARHGVTDDMYGVSFAELKLLKKNIKQDHSLALKLWGTGNHDARMLACMIGDPVQMDRELLEAWAAVIDNYVLGDQFSGFASRSGFAHSCIEDWTMDEREFVAQAGWNIVSLFAVHRNDLDDLFFIPWLSIVMRDIHDRPNRVRHAMNQAVIAIGCRSEALRIQALEVSARIGKVQVDHGKTGCKTPEAAGYIGRTWDRKRKRARG